MWIVGQRWGRPMERSRDSRAPHPPDGPPTGRKTSALMPVPSLRPPVRIILVDDHAVVRRGLCMILEREPDLQVCAEAETLDEGFSAVERMAPDLLVTDLTLAGRGGLELVSLLRNHHPRLPVLVVSMHDADLVAERALAAGARGYVSKSRAEQEVVPAARRLLAGGTYVEGSQAVGTLPVDPVAVLSDREFEVFLLLGAGYAPRHIAEELSLSVSTIEAYRERMKEKLGIASSPLLLRYAVRWSRDQREL